MSQKLLSHPQSWIKLSFVDPSCLSHNIELLSIILPGLSQTAHIQPGTKTLTYRNYLALFKELIPLYGISHNVRSHYQFSLMYRNSKGSEFKWSNSFSGPSHEITQEENGIFDYSFAMVQKYLINSSNDSTRPMSNGDPIC